MILSYSQLPQQYFAAYCGSCLQDICHFHIPDMICTVDGAKMLWVSGDGLLHSFLAQSEIIAVMTFHSCHISFKKTLTFASWQASMCQNTSASLAMSTDMALIHTFFRIPVFMDQIINWLSTHLHHHSEVIRSYLAIS
jgi:hypothetical protein